MQISILMASFYYGDDLNREEYSIYTVTLPSISVFLMTIMIFDWMALFPETSFVVQMLISSLHDTKYFLIMFLICIISFSTGILIVDRNLRLVLEARGEEY